MTSKYYKCTPLAKDIGDRITKWLTDNNKTEKWLAISAKLCRTTVSTITKGRVSPRAETIVALSKVMGVSADWLLFGENKSFKERKM